jgi:hypothetical protein
VPYRYVGRRVRIEYTAETVEIYCQDQRIATHARCRVMGEKTTIPIHRPEHHRAFIEQSAATMTERACGIGPYAGKMVQGFYRNAEHPEFARRKAMGVFGLAKKYGHERTDVACRLALRDSRDTYKGIKAILETGEDISFMADELRQRELPMHENIRGASAYA